LTILGASNIFLLYFEEEEGEAAVGVFLPAGFDDDPLHVDEGDVRDLLFIML